MTPSETWPPRTWASAIAAGTARLEDAPEHLRELVATHLEARNLMVAHWIDRIAAGLARLEDVPRGIRPLVENSDDGREVLVDRWVREVLAGRTVEHRRLTLWTQCPVHLRPAVRDKARAAWEARRAPEPSTPTE